MKELSVIILDLPDKKVVVQRRDASAPSSPNLLALFGGHVASNESPLIAVERELSEETSLDVSKLTIRFEGVRDVPSPNDPHVLHARVHVFRADIPTASFKVNEGVGVETYGPEELRRRNDLSPTLRYLMDH